MSNRSKVLVALQFICLSFLVFHGKLLASGIFLAIQIFGFALSIWSVWVMKMGHFNIQPELKKNAVMVKTGPYKLIRNPMYSGIIIFFGAGIANSFDYLNFLALMFLIIIFLFKIHSEERFMRLRFGNAYSVYQKRTFRLIPFVF